MSLCPAEIITAQDHSTLKPLPLGNWCCPNRKYLGENRAIQTMTRAQWHVRSTFIFHRHPTRRAACCLFQQTHGWERPFVPRMPVLVLAETLFYPSAAPCLRLHSTPQKIAPAFLPRAKQRHLSAQTQVQKPGSRHRRGISTTSCLRYRGYRLIWCYWRAVKDVTIVVIMVWCRPACQERICSCKRTKPQFHPSGAERVKNPPTACSEMHSMPFLL